ncbi:hypothetical protein ASPWEDRAFT_748330 [Aspergillus wentii DTO 134E9]|uniref:Uncharacterized protein n=1 Tax=Aspergillus wentii DTO 134E9 TaxID=1073089 RepID=A0A1L9R6D7_ASPWE|nr:uncharacterized protein ASPWEDRAFT_748330 [Aspergillus wentii DTO 134E9]KAI9926883.1 hypothetical protein MW887_003981 [Aspergillus wentii]OJJ30447.1 hypothetical protein ASPWEDRAFT_748330 [Aspergillus wentii DTO 134E9]
MTEYQNPVQTGYFEKRPTSIYDVPFVPYWARHTQCARDLLECSDEPIEYDHEDEDYQDNCFFFPEDCSWSPPKDWVIEAEYSEDETTSGSCDDEVTMIPGLPDIKMLDAEALGDLLEDNLSPPEITSILVFSTNGAIFAHASSLPTRQLRNLSATYGAAYTCYAKNASSGNLTGVNPASHPSSYVTAQSISLGDVGSIVFELDDLVSVVTRIADKVLLAAVGPSKLGASTGRFDGAAESNGARTNGHGASNPTSGHTTHNHSRAHSEANVPIDAHLQTQYEIDRSTDLARLEGLNLSASPAILLALESKSAALGKFLSQKLEDLESPEDF